jgi:hypothetical protein
MGSKLLRRLCPLPRVAGNAHWREVPDLVGTTTRERDHVIAGEALGGSTVNASATMPCDERQPFGSGMGSRCAAAPGAPRCTVLAGLLGMLRGPALRRLSNALPEDRVRGVAVLRVPPLRRCLASAAPWMRRPPRPLPATTTFRLWVGRVFGTQPICPARAVDLDHPRVGLPPVLVPDAFFFARHVSNITHRRN